MENTITWFKDFLEHFDKAKEGDKLIKKEMRGTLPEMFDALIDPAASITTGMDKEADVSTVNLKLAKEPFETSKFWVYPGSLTTLLILQMSRG